METAPSGATSPKIGARLNQLLVEARMTPLGPRQLDQFEAYYSLLQRWNGRMNLTAIRDQEGILSRHFVESIACAVHLQGEGRTLLDFGSGAGFPGIPIAICRPAIQVTLAESQGKKASFLREAVRTLGLGATVHAGRAETLPARFDCVILRAVDRMGEAVRIAASLVDDHGWLGVVTTAEDRGGLIDAVSEKFVWQTGIPLPASDTRVLVLGRRLAG
jgi:16S rRNA (guanine527-N7)-methyltransferase